MQGNKCWLQGNRVCPLIYRKTLIIMMQRGSFLAILAIIMFLWLPSSGSTFDEFFQDPLKDGGLGPKMVVVPAGQFYMGDIQGGGL